jgi:hypothetical protein
MKDFSHLFVRSEIRIVSKIWIIFEFIQGQLHENFFERTTGTD